MAMAVATNLRLPEDLLKALKYRAIEEKKSMNQIIREAIEMSLAAVPQAEGREKDAFEEEMTYNLRGDIKRLTNFTPEYRLRISDYRVLFEIENETIIIYRIRHRREAYR